MTGAIEPGWSLIHIMKRPAFSLIEMLVVISVITLLISILLPSLGAARFEGIKSKCAQQMRQIAVATDAFTVDHNGQYIQARDKSVQIAINVNEQKQFEQYGYPAQNWACPGRNFIPQVEAAFDDSLLIGYQYFGGIPTWRNQAGTFPSKSPLLRAKAGSNWVIAADTSVKVDGVWGGGRVTAFGDMPSHRRTTVYPEGSNQAYVDCSVKWVQFEEMTMLHSWSPTARMCFFKQDDVPAGMDENLLVPAIDHLP